MAIGRQNTGKVFESLTSGKNFSAENMLKTDILKITVIGAMGAGKTWYMASMFYKFVNNVNIMLMSLEKLHNPSGNPIISQKIIDAIKLTRYLEEKWDDVREGKRVGNEDLTNLQLHVLFKHIPAFDIKFIDYAGGALTLVRGREVQTNDIQNAIWESDALIFILDTKVIYENDLINIRDKLELSIIRQICESLFINDKMKSFIAAPFMLTKVDELRRLIKTENDKEFFIQKCTELIEPLASPFIDAGIPMGYFPVSAIGLDAYKPKTDDIFNNISPLWVENPVLFCANKWMDREIQKLEKELENWEDGKKGFLYGITPVYFIEKKQKEIEKYRTEIETKIQLYKKIQDTISDDYNVEVGEFNEFTGAMQLKKWLDVICKNNGTLQKNNNKGEINVKDSFAD